jgi:acetylornithine deacetylase/succinyl-diaminopimelate desuccinylase-like protein
MSDPAAEVAALTRDLVQMDSRSRLSNLAIAERVEAELPAFEIERIDFADPAGTPKRALVARRGGAGGIAFSGHLDTVPDTGWQDDPWSGRLDDAGVLHGLGSADMKGPLAAAIVAARGLPNSVPVSLLVTTDEETTKQGAREIVARSELVRRAVLRGILVVEPTGMIPVRGHRSHILYTAVAIGVQAHSSTGKGRNANWTLLPFIQDMHKIFERLRDDPALHDAAYDPPFSDFNMVVDNHGAAVNVTVPKATATIKFRYSARIDPTPITDAVRAAAERAGVALTVTPEGNPPELPPDHPLVRLCVTESGAAPRTAPFGTDACVLAALAPCVVFGPGDIAEAHTPTEKIRLSDLAAAVPLLQRLAERVAAG